MKEENSSKFRSKEFLDSIRLQINERLSSPLIGSFVLSWIVWNYRMIAVLFSNLTIGDRFQYIDTVLYRTKGESLLHHLFGPLACALAYIFLYPYPAKFIQGFWLRRANEQKEQRDQILRATVLTLEESEQIIMSAERRVREAREETKVARQELELTRQALEIRPKAEIVSEEILEEQKRMLRRIVDPHKSDALDREEKADIAIEIATARLKQSIATLKSAKNFVEGIRHLRALQKAWDPDEEQVTVIANDVVVLHALRSIENSAPVRMWRDEYAGGESMYPEMLHLYKGHKIIAIEGRAGRMTAVAFERVQIVSDEIPNCLVVTEVHFTANGRVGRTNK